MQRVTVEELAVPADASAPDAADFVAAVEVLNATNSAGYGTAEFNRTAAEILPEWKDPASPRRLFGVRADGRLVARGVLDWLVDDRETMWIFIAVHPSYRGRGIGTQLAETLEGLAVADGRTKLITYAVSPDAAGPRLESPTSFGSLPLAGPEVQFLLHRGYTLEQVVRGSRLPLPLADLEEKVQFGLMQAQTGIRIHQWTDRVPDEWAEDMALLRTRMSTDAPSAGLEEPEDIFTVERLQELEEHELASPTSTLTCVVEHVPSGHLAGFTTLKVPAELHRAVHQDDTLVLREHRGHRFGMLLKVANLAYLSRTRPGHPSVVTWNAEENRPMLDVNEAIGFVPMGYEGAWRKDLG